jgi:hypothetical protein
MVPSLEKSRNPQAPWKKTLARYRRLAACMIDESSGYFTPKAVVMALEAHKKREYWGCEWYSHIDSLRNPGKMWDNGYNERVKVINHDVISEAFKRRQVFRQNKGARAIVEANIDGYDSVFASWF